MRASTRGLGGQELRAPPAWPPAWRIRAASQPWEFGRAAPFNCRSNSCRKQPHAAASRSRSPTATSRPLRLPEVQATMCDQFAYGPRRRGGRRLPCISDSLEAGAGAAGAPNMFCSDYIALRVHRADDRWLTARRLTERPAKCAWGAAGGLCARRGARASSMTSSEAAPVLQTARTPLCREERRLKAAAWRLYL